MDGGCRLLDPAWVGRDGDAERQPIYLTDKDENPNHADVLLLTDGVVSERVADFARCLNLFDGQDEQAVAAARALWKDWKNLGYDLTYYQQTDRGGWWKRPGRMHQTVPRLVWLPAPT